MFELFTDEYEPPISQPHSVWALLAVQLSITDRKRKNRFLPGHLVAVFVVAVQLYLVTYFKSKYPLCGVCYPSFSEFKLFTQGPAIPQFLCTVWVIVTSSSHLNNTRVDVRTLGRHHTNGNKKRKKPTNGQPDDHL